MPWIGRTGGFVMGILLWTAGIFLAGSCFAEGRELRERLLSEGLTYWREDAELVYRFQGTVYQQAGAIDELNRNTEIHVRTSRGNLLLERRPMLNGSSEDQSTIEVLGLSRDRGYAFRLHRTRDGEGWVLINVQPLDGPNPSSIADRIEGALRTYSPSYLVRQNLHEMVEQPFFRVVSVAQDGEVVRLEFDYTHTRDQLRPFNWVQGGTIWLNPNYRWRPVKASLRCRDAFDSSVTWTIEITLSHDFTGALSYKGEREVHFGTDERTFRKYALDANLPAPSSYDFTLTAFGLPEPHWSARPTPWYLFLGAAAVVLFVLGALGYYFAQRRN